MVDPPTHIDVHVGQDIDLHMTVAADGAPPLYPLPVPDDPLVVRGWFIENDAQMTYRALAPGTTRLMTTGPCGGPGTSATFNGPCPAVEITVAPIETDCTTVEQRLCQTVAATAVLWGFFPEPGETVTSWKVESSELIGCGDLNFHVTLIATATDVPLSITVGQHIPKPTGLQEFELCTY